MDTREQQNAELRGRPTSESEVVRLTEAQEAVRTALETDLGLGPWADTGTGGNSGCPQFDRSNGEIRSLASLLLEGGVPDEVWPRAAELVQQTAAQYGFTAADVVVDRPGEHEIVLRGEWESLLRFGTLANATLRLVTGCHLPAAAGY